VSTLALETQKNRYARQDESCLQADCRANMKISYNNLHKYFANLKNNILCNGYVLLLGELQLLNV
jgi:hypothetical protein